MPRPPVRASRAERTRRAVEDRAEEPVRRGARRAARQEDPDDEQQAVVAPRRARGERERHARKEHDQQHGLGAVGRRLRRIVAERGEDGARRLEDEHRPQPPFAHGYLVTICPLWQR